MKTGGGSGGMKNAPGKHPGGNVPGQRANTGGKRAAGPTNTIPGSTKTSKGGHPGGTSVPGKTLKSGSSGKGNLQFSGGNNKKGNRPLR